MKVSISLPKEDVDFLDEYARAVGSESRSAVVQKAVRLLRVTALGPSYSKAWEEWESEGDAEAWESVIGDGLGNPEIG